MDTGVCAVQAAPTRRQIERTLKRLPLARQAELLRAPEIRRVLGAAETDRRIRQLHAQLQRLEDQVCSGAWAEAAAAGQVFPPGGKHGTAMVLSSVGTRSGDGYHEDGQPRARQRTPRWTPPQCVAMEDALDCMSLPQAMSLSYRSSSAVVIAQVAERRGIEMEGTR